MQRKKLNPHFILWSLLWLLVASCGSQKSTSAASQPIVVLYENDVHCAVDGYAKLAAVKKEILARTPFVKTVSCGDFLQGGVIGALNQGESVVRIMNAVGYDYLTLGNHEFDYGLPVLNERIGELKGQVLDANFCHLDTKQPVLKPYAIADFGHTQVAFIGLTTPTVLETGKVFTNPQGERLYSFLAGDELEIRVQQLVDKARAEGADYVVVLSHLGDQKPSPANDNSSVRLIHRTKGIDVVLDGHAHSVIRDSLVLNVQGQPVHLTSTGTGFQYLGVLELDAQGQLQSRLLKTADCTAVDSVVLQTIRHEQEVVMRQGRDTVFRTEFPLGIDNAQGVRTVRSEENALGNLLADVYRMATQADVCMLNGGGIRANLPIGAVTKNDLIAVLPFLQDLCTAQIKGSQLADALEFAYMLVPVENGGFQQVSGLRCTIDATQKPEVTLDADGMYLGVPASAKRRVGNIEILNPKTNAYEPLDMNRSYRIVSNVYQLQGMGSSGLFRGVTDVQDASLNELTPLIDYLQRQCHGVVPESYRQTEGRIQIILGKE